MYNTNTIKQEYYIFVRVFRMFASFAFAITEISISKTTSDLIALPRAGMTAETKEILRGMHRKREMEIKIKIKIKNINEKKQSKKFEFESGEKSN